MKAKKKDKTKPKCFEPNWERPKGALIDMNLSRTDFSIDDHFELVWKLHNLSNVEVLAWLAIMNHKASKSLETLYQNSCDKVNEGTDDEDDILDEQRFKEARRKITEEAKVILKNTYHYDLTDIDDLYDLFEVHIEQYP